MMQRRKPGPLQVFRTVLLALFGVRRKSGHEDDTAALTPLQIIVAGVVAAALFVLTLVLIVRFVTAQ